MLDLMKYCSLKPSQANSLQDPISKITRAKWTGGVAQVVSVPALQMQSPEFKPSHTHTYKYIYIYVYIYTYMYMYVYTYCT
jgi:hypothetical protein